MSKPRYALTPINGGTLWGIWDSREEVVVGDRFDRRHVVESLAAKMNRQMGKFRAR